MVGPWQLGDEITTLPNPGGYKTVRVRECTNTSDWIQQGDDIVGGGEYYYFVYIISLSSNGSVLAVGAPFGGCKIASCWLSGAQNQNGGEVRVSSKIRL